MKWECVQNTFKQISTKYNTGNVQICLLTLNAQFQLNQAYVNTFT